MMSSFYVRFMVSVHQLIAASDGKINIAPDVQSRLGLSLDSAESWQPASVVAAAIRIAQPLNSGIDQIDHHLNTELCASGLTTHAHQLTAAYRGISAADTAAQHINEHSLAALRAADIIHQHAINGIASVVEDFETFSSSLADTLSRTDLAREAIDYASLVTQGREAIEASAHAIIRICTLHDKKVGEILGHLLESVDTAMHPGGDVPGAMEISSSQPDPPVVTDSSGGLLLSAANLDSPVVSLMNTIGANLHRSMVAAQAFCQASHTIIEVLADMIEHSLSTTDQVVAATPVAASPLEETLELSSQHQTPPMAEPSSPIEASPRATVDPETPITIQPGNAETVFQPDSEVSGLGRGLHSSGSW
ncbi:hypothetical protein NXS13_03065 [Corynebacterium sp. ES2730-CONJ]|uniref:hypothetical protein n=1 Tax=Corynebacterium sp. ES2730-CONJ TaxID=2973941 RepID=UPI00216B0275|nr:hypothetical protein [Corynebacterium sp. ES2730-CONJ]MCS4531488.1 hypothetical protein [Corynebacterium sp. ES2730-CONJ]